MICRGHVPVINSRGRINRESRQFLLYFLPKGLVQHQPNLSNVARSLHLAFKGMETEEIYDVLMEQLVSAIGKYDPTYKDKVREVVGVLNRQLGAQRGFSILEVNRYVDFDSNRHIRMLCRRGFLGANPEERQTVPEDQELNDVDSTVRATQ